MKPRDAASQGIRPGRLYLLTTSITYYRRIPSQAHKDGRELHNASVRRGRRSPFTRDGCDILVLIALRQFRKHYNHLRDKLHGFPSDGLWDPYIRIIVRGRSEAKVPGHGFLLILPPPRHRCRGFSYSVPSQGWLGALNVFGRLYTSVPTRITAGGAHAIFVAQEHFSDRRCR